MNKEAIKQKIAELQALLEEPKEPVRWKPSVGPKYFYINPYGKKIKKTWSNHEWDINLWEANNCFRTEDEAIDSYIWLGFKLQQSEYHYWIPGMDMSKPDKTPEGCEVYNGAGWVQTDSMPENWLSSVRRWPKQ